MLLLALPAGLLTLLVYLIIILVVGGLIFWAVKKLSVAFNIPEPVTTVIIVVLVVVIVIALLYLLLGAIPT